MRELEQELDKVENEDAAEDPEAMMRAATVNIQTEKDPKFLGPSSGIAITRLVMQLAKQFADATTIRDIVPAERARQIKDLNHQEQAKPTSKVYPLISDVAAVELPNRALTDLLVTVYKLKVQPLYPALHEPTLDRDVDTVYGGDAVPSQHFVVRMVIAISLQKLDTQYAGLADSYYLAALKHLEPVVKAMDLKTLQCFALMAEYSLLTPTRTAIFYVVGIAVRLAQSLGFHEEKTITRPGPDGKIDYLEIDMRRRLFYCILVMELGLSHSLGRPSMLATSWSHLDVEWFETCDDKYITSEGIDPAADRPTLKKWICIHFFKMRVLQLEIRRKLYLKKRPEPKDDTDRWFIEMEAKLKAWRDASPSADEAIGLDKVWFTARYSTMVVFLFRPSPQVPRPSVQAALKCYEACEFAILIQREQITKKTVDMTWVFTQTLFMGINTMLWSLSYEEVRKKYNREAAANCLDTAMDAIQLASERWPGVTSAVKLYQNLIAAILKIYEKDGDVPISAASPSEIASPPLASFPEGARSQTTSPATLSSISVATPPASERPNAALSYLHQQRSSVERIMPYQPDTDSTAATPPARESAPIPTPPAYHSQAYDNDFGLATTYQNSMPQQQQQQQHQQQYFDPFTQFNPLPQFTPHLTIPNWAPAGHLPLTTQAPMQSHFDAFTAQNPVFDPTHPSYPFPATIDANLASSNNNNNITGSYLPPHQQYQQQYPEYLQHQLQQQQQQLPQPSWDMDAGAFGAGLTQVQQEELMLSLETDGMEDIQSMIESTLQAITPKPAQYQTFRG